MNCERALEYVYGELDEAQKRAFEEHLPTCARCQAEVASFGRVRAATKQLMAPKEPTAQLTGALHAQLMHAAAQRRPKRGVLLSFARRIAEHPALAAAAMFVIVGGAIAFNWSRGKLAMPATSPAATTETAEPAAAAPKAEEAPATAAEPVPAPKEKEKAEAPGEFKDASKIALQTPQGKLAVTRAPTAHRAVAKTEAAKLAAPAKLQAPPKKAIALDGNKGGKRDALDELAADDKAAESEGFSGVLGGAAGGGAATGAKSSAPGDLNAMHAAKQANKPAPEPARSRGAYVAQGPSTPPAAQPAPPPPLPMAASSSSANEQRMQMAVAKPGAGRNYDVLRKQADEYAQSRCDDAIKIYTELEKAGQYISPTERVKWIRCLTQKGRQEEAQQRLDELKAEKRTTNAQIQDAERELSDSRRAKKAKKAPAADRAVPTSAERRASEPPPAQATPPDATHTKVDSKGQAY